jgi:GTP-sensing pleiotropic transcriptional regulator CodY
MNNPSKNKFIQLWLIIGIVAGFLVILFFTITYLNNNILCDVDCRIQNGVSLVLISMSLFGMFVGSLTYYFISEKYEKQITKIQKDATLTLKFLGGEEKAIIKSILNHKGKTTQSEIAKDIGQSRVKIFRSLKKLEEKGIITKKPNGMTNSIELEENLRKVLIE